MFSRALIGLVVAGAEGKFAVLVLVEQTTDDLALRESGSRQDWTRLVR